MGSWKKVSVGRSVILRPIKTFFGFFFSVFFSSSEKSSFFLANFVQNGIAPSLHLRVCLRHDAGRQRWSNWRFPLETVRRFSARRLSPKDVRGKKSYCHGICGWAFPNRGQEGVAYVCRDWCKKGNVEWSQPSEGVKICLLSCKMTPAGCNYLCEKRCNEECDRRFPTRILAQGST